MNIIKSFRQNIFSIFLTDTISLLERKIRIINGHFKALILHCNLEVLPTEKIRRTKQVISHCDVWLNFYCYRACKKIVAKIKLMIRPENSHRVRIDRDICQIMPKIIIRFDGNKVNYRIN